MDKTPISKPPAADVLSVTEGTSPLMLSFPHSGDVYPDDFGFDPKLSYSQIDNPSDKYVDELFGASNELGLTTIKANFPRAYVDVNRHQHDIDANMLDNPKAWPGRFLPSGSVEVGATLFWSKSYDTPIYNRKLTVEEAHNRLSSYFIPYHQTMTRLVERLRAQHGKVYIVDCHSMTRFDQEIRGGKERPEIDIGTRNGASCDPDISEKMAELFAARGYDVGMNKRFIGGEITLRYGWPKIGQHILQVEVRRDLYMNEETRARNENFAKVQADCAWVLNHFKTYIEHRQNAAAPAVLETT
ncbi:N-formylglutamate amidohydrolase [Primorskyibacter flagellatus]|uniref:N-formylglutamate amidohydrolase n=2 Tax=Primorskyibacter flagellatus TaxID=1387277 RepID=A0A1W2DY03_9RHOB|nr:N-formylglutamate amidohydrolase [Primorskyibacter flagellatus]